MEMDKSINVLGEALELCGDDPVTGFFRDGKCNTCNEDVKNEFNMDRNFVQSIENSLCDFLLSPFLQQISFQHDDVFVSLFLSPDQFLALVTQTFFLTFKVFVP